MLTCLSLCLLWWECLCEHFWLTISAVTGLLVSWWRITMVYLVRLIQPNHLIGLVLNRDLRSQCVLLWERAGSCWYRYPSRLNWSSSHHFGVANRWSLSLMPKWWLVVLLWHVLLDNKGCCILLWGLICHKIEIILLIVLISGDCCCRQCCIRVLTVRRVEHCSSSLTLLGIGKGVRRIHMRCHNWKIF